MHRTENLQRLATEEFDLCIIGGGASGAGCALDAALRGLKVALIEKNDFAAETSSKSTKLVHGGVRYLEQAFKNLDFAQLRQVKHGLEERHIVLQNAPHLARPLGLITPVFSWWEGLYFTIGLKLYDWFAHKKGGLPESRWLSKKEALSLMPGISPKIHSAVLYYDGQLDDARYALALIQSAAECQAVVANHLKVVGFRKDELGKIQSAQVEDQCDTQNCFEVKARQFLNCTGPYADSIRQLANPETLPRIRPSKGVHLVLPQTILQSQMAMLIPKTRDGRMVFAIPFEGTLLLGTTDEPYGDLEKEPVLEARDVQFLLETLKPFVAQKLDSSQVTAGFGGIRPLIGAANHPNHSVGKQTKSLLRDHEIELDPVSGLISLLGGKWTTYRLMALDAVNRVEHALEIQNCRKRAPKESKYSTQNYPLVGAAGYSDILWKNLNQKFGLDPAICQHLASKYGGRSIKVAELTLENPTLSERLSPKYPFIKAEIIYAVQEEMALTLRDFLARRIRLELIDWHTTRALVPEVAHWMGKALGWSLATETAEIQAYQALLDEFIAQSIQQ